MSIAKNINDKIFVLCKTKLFFSQLNLLTPKID